MPIMPFFRYIEPRFIISSYLTDIPFRSFKFILKLDWISILRDHRLFISWKWLGMPWLTRLQGPIIGFGTAYIYYTQQEITTHAFKRDTKSNVMHFTINLHLWNHIYWYFNLHYCGTKTTFSTTTFEESRDSSIFSRTFCMTSLGQWY